MKSNGMRLLPLLLVCSLNTVLTTHDCLNLKPLPDFDMKRFLGRWYAVTTTLSPNQCLVYEFTHIQKRENIDCALCDEDSASNVECVKSINCTRCVKCVACKDSENCKHCRHCKECKNCEDSTWCEDCIDCVSCVKCIGCIGCFNCIGCENLVNQRDLVGVKNPRLPFDVVTYFKYNYFGQLVADPELPSTMSVYSTQDGKASFNVFATDYVTYAGVYTCQDMPACNKHSITILSRTKDLDKANSDKIMELILSAKVHPSEFKTVDHSNCDHPFERSSVDSIDQSVVDDDAKVYVSVDLETAEEMNPRPTWML
ncbi:uncharacterized protein LOC126843642 [Adelges cooleyi]|uniref:uncharacterized protein LOC126843642 n=1 Tax=Adelges cooleyi TaxID=133065 RepID=UPI00217FD70E|nr:uncharacterized protein LOC126843642 [Adelges cooleyi]